MNRISIITINYNNVNGLKRTIDSVLAQTAQDFEYIIVDGGSKDGSKELIEKHDADISSWVSEKDMGIYDAMNKGIAMSHGEYLLFLNSGDCFIDCEVLDKVNSFIHDNDCDFISGSMIYEDESLGIKTPPEKVSIWYMLTDFLPHPSTFIKSTLLKKRPYRMDLKIVSDWEQMFYEITKNDATYRKLDLMISSFDCSGISTNEDKTPQNRERELAVKDIISSRMMKDIETAHQFQNSNQNVLESKYERNVQFALFRMPTSISRDLKIMRNSFKMLIKDIFR